MSYDVAHDILGFVPESEAGSIGPVSNIVPKLTGAHYYPGYKDALARILFLEAAYRGGPAFKEGIDRKGQKIFLQHERESDVRYTRRRNLTTYRNYVGPIIDLYANHLMTTTPTRSKRDKFVEWCIDVDGTGRTLHAFMKRVAIKALLAGKFWIGVDLPRDESGTLTKLTDKRKPYLLPVSHANVVDVSLDSTGAPTRIVIHHEKYIKPDFATAAKLEHEYHEWTAEWVRIWRPAQARGSDTLEEVVKDMPSGDGGIVSIPKPGFTLKPGSEIKHGYGQVPFRCVSVLEGKGIAEDIAECNKTVLNLVGLLYEELYNQTFTQTYITGVSPDEADDAKFGSQTVHFIPSPEAAIHSAGANPEQARSIMNALADEVKEMHRMAHMEHSGEPVQKRVAEAASKLEKSAESMDQLLEDLADNLQSIENVVLGIAASFKTNWVTASDAQTAYSKVFDTKTLREKISLIVELDKAPFIPPQVIKGLAQQVAEEVLETGERATDALDWLSEVTDSGSPQGSAIMKMKLESGAAGPVEVYKAYVDPSASDDEALTAIRKIAKLKEELAPDPEPEEGGEEATRQPGRPEAQPTPEERRKAVEKKQAANQA